MADDANPRHSTVLDDPGSRAVAQGYVTAYLDAAEQTGIDVGGAVADLRSLVEDVFEPNPQLRELVVEGLVSRDEQMQLVERAVAPRVPEVLANLLRVLVSHDRAYLLPVVAREAGVKFNERMGRQVVKVFAAQSIDQGRYEHICRSLDAALPFEPIVEVEIDPALMGGLVVQVGDKVYDASVRARLSQLREQLVARRVGS